MDRRKLQAADDCRRVADHMIVGCSGGKDSVAVLELLHERGIRLSAYHCYVVRGLAYQQRYFDYLQRRYGFELVDWPHPDLGMFYANGIYCATMHVPQHTMRDVWDAARQRFGVKWVATGEKKIDSLERRGMLSAWGAVEVARCRAFPLAEWNNRDVFAFLKHRGIPLAPDYALFGSSMANPLDPRFLAPLARYYPQDYQRVCAAFPFARAVLYKATTTAEAPA